MSHVTLTQTRVDVCETADEAEVTESALSQWLTILADSPDHLDGEVVRDGLTVTLRVRRSIT